MSKSARRYVDAEECTALCGCRKAHDAMWMLKSARRCMPFATMRDKSVDVELFCLGGLLARDKNFTPHSSRRGEKGPSSIRRTLELFQRQQGGNFREAGCGKSGLC